MATNIVSSAIVLEVLRNDNYANWSVCIKNYLLAQDLWDIIEATTEPPKLEDDKENFRAWRKKNAMALHAIQITCGLDIFSQIREISSAKVAWDTLAKMLEPQSIGINPGNLLQLTGVNSSNPSLPLGVSPNNSLQLSGVNQGNLPPPPQGVNPVNVAQLQGINPAIAGSISGTPSLPLGVNLGNPPELAEVNPGNIQPLGVNPGNPGITSLPLGVNTSNSLQSTGVNPPQLPGVIPGNSSPSQGLIVNNPPQSLGVNPGTENNECLQFQPLFQAINKGDLDGVKSFIELHPGAKSAKIIHTGLTALHVASDAGQVKIVEELVQLMSKEDLEIQSSDGYTALFPAALSGITKLAECMIRKNKKLVSIPNMRGDIPVVVACCGGHKDMTRYLYSVTPLELLIPENGTHGSLLLNSSIIGKIFDVALDLIRRCPRLATLKNHQGSIPVTTLSSMPSLFPSGSQLAFWKRLIYSCIHVQLPAPSSEFRVDIPQTGEIEQQNQVAQVLGKFRRSGLTLLEFLGIKELYDMKLIHLHAVEIQHCMCKEISTLDLTKPHGFGVYAAVLEAVKHGIVEFVVEIIKANPDLLYTADMNARGIFMSAIGYRQEKIFSLIYGLDTRKDSLITSVDKFGNYMLHIAGMLAPSFRISRISGAALQMQRELQWYKEVESIVNPMFQVCVNKDNEQPRQVFTNNHMNLVKQGEEWMKQTANSCTVVGALIITIMFTAAFTVPGGNDQNTGYPMFLHKKSFTVFIISDAVSLFASSTSVLMFLGILTSRYAEDDFLKSLPTKLIIGLSTLFFSIAAMMVAFCAAVVIMLKGRLGIVIPIILLASLPVTLFIWLQFPLLVEIFISTYGSGIFNRKMKRWL